MWGCLAKVNVSINKKRKLGPKIVDCVFLSYSFHNIGYRFFNYKLWSTGHVSWYNYGV
jgi:hypothetical protein